MSNFSNLLYMSTPNQAVGGALRKVRRNSKTVKRTSRKTSRKTSKKISKNKK